MQCGYYIHTLYVRHCKQNNEHARDCDFYLSIDIVLDFLIKTMKLY